LVKVGGSTLSECGYEKVRGKFYHMKCYRKGGDDQLDIEHKEKEGRRGKKRGLGTSTRKALLSGAFGSQKTKSPSPRGKKNRKYARSCKKRGS